VTKTTNDTWNPAQYELFQEQRSQPFFDLLALVQPREAMRVLDLGCGTGELTKYAHETLRAKETLGVDSWRAMLEKSAAFASASLRFAHADISEFTPPAQFDLVLSNAALQWLQDHARLLPRIASLVAEGGQLAIQMPANFDHPSHLVAKEVAREPSFRSLWKTEDRPVNVLRPEDYATILNELGFQKQHVRLQVYGHLLRTRHHVVEWVKGTMLTAYKKDLSDRDYERFVARYTEVLLPRLGASDPYFYAFKRILIWAKR
jgi:trans-aconitate 2-methyltransferase